MGGHFFLPASPEDAILQTGNQQHPAVHIIHPKKCRKILFIILNQIIKNKLQHTDNMVKYI